jgi:hypothetical protein
MNAFETSPFFRVRLSVPRRDGGKAWGTARGDFERRLAQQTGTAVTASRVDSEVRRGRDFVRVVVVMTVAAADVVQALDIAWRAFRMAADGDADGWDMPEAVAEVRPA